MRKTLLLSIALIAVSNCSERLVLRRNNATPTRNEPINKIAIVTPSRSPIDSTKGEEKKEVPSDFASIDFKNLSYPIKWKHQTIKLTNGRLEFFEDKIFYN